MTFTVSSVEEKVQNACHRLNAEAYEHQVLANKGHALKQFTPCPKAEALMQVIRKGVHFGTAHIIAARTICPCHNSLSEYDLTKYECDPTYKEANFQHDYRTLYPRLFQGGAR